MEYAFLAEEALIGVLVFPGFAYGLLVIVVQGLDRQPSAGQLDAYGHDEHATALLAIILASSIIFELIGPVLAKLGLYLSKSYGHEDIDEVAPVSEQANVDEGSSKEIDKLAAQIDLISKEIPALAPEEANEAAFTEAAEEYESANYSRNRRGFINRK